MPIQTRPNWTQLTNRPTTVAASGLADAATVTQATQAAPPGTIAYFAMGNQPTGWLRANGAAVSRTTFAALFAVLGPHYGAGDGSTTFNLPDLRGEFLRGWDDGRGADSGRPFGSAQAQDIQPHSHVLTATANATNGGIAAWWGGNGTGIASIATANSTGTETRPRNVALLACIKF